MSSSKTSTKPEVVGWERKYLERLADVYLEKFTVYGYKTARDWYGSFLTPELRKLVHPIIVEKVNAKQKERDK